MVMGWGGRGATARPDCPSPASGRREGVTPPRQAVQAGGAGAVGSASAGDPRKTAAQAPIPPKKPVFAGVRVDGEASWGVKTGAQAPPPQNARLCGCAGRRRRQLGLHTAVWTRPPSPDRVRVGGGGSGGAVPRLSGDRGAWGRVYPQGPRFYRGARGTVGLARRPAASSRCGQVEARTHPGLARDQTG